MPTIPTGLTITRSTTWPNFEVTLSWVPPTDATSVSIERTHDGINWIRRQLGAVSSVTYNDLTVDAQYGFQVRAENPFGLSAWSDPVWMWTAPAAHTDLTATRTGGPLGSFVEFRAKNPSLIATSMQLQSSTDSGTSWMNSTIANLAVDRTYWRAVSASNTLTLWRVRNVGPDGQWSDWVQTSVPAIATPSPPTNLSGGNFDATLAKSVTWTLHSNDGSGQYAYEIQTSYLSGGSYTAWMTSVAKVTAAGSGGSIPARTLTNERDYRYRVRVWHASDTASDWSVEQYFSTHARSTVTMVHPTVGEVITDNTLATRSATSTQPLATFVWRVTTPEGRPLGSLGDGGTGWGTLTDDQTYVATVWSTYQDVLSDPVSHTFTVGLPKPAAPTAMLLWDETSAAVTMTVTNPAGTPAAVSNEVRRSDGSLVGVAAVNGTLVDPLPPVATSSYYLLSSVSASGAKTTVTVPLAAPTHHTAGCVWINGGPTYLTAVHFSGGDIDESVSNRAVTLRDYDGEPLPIPAWDANLQPVRTVAFRTLLRPGSTSSADQVRALLAMKGIVCWRDDTGRRIFGVLTGTGESLRNTAWSNLTLNLTETGQP